MATQHDSGSSRRNDQDNPWRWNPGNNVLACFRVFKRLSSNEAVPSIEITQVRPYLEVGAPRKQH
eukprot:9475879-Pyramimonas_sp.AAC.1